MRFLLVIGARISLSIQLIIYMSQFGFGILLLIAAYHVRFYFSNPNS
jgi:hypothetical protein